MSVPDEIAVIWPDADTLLIGGRWLAAEQTFERRDPSAPTVRRAGSRERRMRMSALPTTPARRRSPAGPQ